MQWNIPNILTLFRVVISAGLFVMLGFYDHTAPWAPLLMAIAFVTFVITAMTDILDGYLARKLKQVTAFGRMTDPIVDKILIVGCFVMLSGPNFSAVTSSMLREFDGGLPAWMSGNMITGIRPWMAVVVLSREFIVSGIRSYSESKGIEYPATPVGKIKMFLQSFATGSVIFCLAWGRGVDWQNTVHLIAIWVAVLATVLSGIMYIVKAKALFVSQRKESDG
jgi:phosphatidylglycerophosphate synthase